MPPADARPERSPTPPPALAPSPAAAPARLARAARLAPWLAYGLVLVVGLALVWPLPRGVMPMSADHTVHLTRAWLYGQVLAAGELRGWSSMWFFGAPVGELYPPLGDLIVILLRLLSFGQASWATAYAWMVSLVFVLQGWALVHAGVTLGRAAAPGRPLPVASPDPAHNAGTAAAPMTTPPAPARMIAGASVGALAGILALVDAGTYREGGWIYTVLYGVWPQALATSLAVLCLSEAVRGRQAALRRDRGSSDKEGQRHLLKAGLAGGLALLAHPMSLPSLALAGGLGLVLLPRVAPPLAETPAQRDRGIQTRSTRHLRTIASGVASASADLVMVAGIALVLAAWWLLPMLAHRGWMASYGWLHAPLATMTEMAKSGHWTANMPSAVGYAAWLGLVLVALRGSALARLLGAWALLQWLLASSDSFAGLRLDHLSEGFSHVQYQRFLIAAKPGLFLLAAIGIVGLAQLIVGLWRSRLRSHLRVPLAMLLGGGLALLSAGVLSGSRTEMARFKVGEVPTERFFHLAAQLRPGAKDKDKTRGPSPADLAAREASYDELLLWLAERWRERQPGERYRIAFQAGRNAHWFMDSPLVTQTPTYKLGFTPGDNFVHKPEAGAEALLDRLGVRYLIRERGRARGREVASFGPFTVFERDAPSAAGWADPVATLAHIEGPGQVELVSGDPESGALRLRIRGADRSGSRLVVHLGGYPRWELEQDGKLLPWVETPAISRPRGAQPVADATPDERRRGLLRGGKANGDDGTEPTLVAAAIGDGEVTLVYRRWRPLDIIAALLSLAGLLTILVLWRRRPVIDRLRRLARRALPAWLQLAALGLLVAVLATRWRRAASAESSLASAWFESGRASVIAPSGGPQPTVGPLKSDMLLRPAILLPARAHPPTSVIFPGVLLGEGLEGYAALDDDAAKGRRRGRQRLRIELRPAGAGAATPWEPRVDLRLPHRPGRSPLRVDPAGVGPTSPVDLRVTIESEGDAPPPAGFNLDLRPQAAAGGTP